MSGVFSSCKHPPQTAAAASDAPSLPAFTAHQEKADADAEKYEEAKRADEAAGAEQSVRVRSLGISANTRQAMVQRHIRSGGFAVIFLNDAKLF